MQMSDRNETIDSRDSARAAMRSRLSQEFRSLHRRRRQQRIAAACLAPAALVAAFVVWNWSGSPQPTNSPPPAEQMAQAPAVPPSTEKVIVEEAPKLAENNGDTNAPKAADFQHIDFIELKPDDLPKWLAEAKSDLIVYQVDGRTEVVSERELLASSSKKRKPRVN